MLAYSLKKKPETIILQFSRIGKFSNPTREIRQSETGNLTILTALPVRLANLTIGKSHVTTRIKTVNLKTSQRQRTL